MSQRVNNLQVNELITGPEVRVQLSTRHIQHASSTSMQVQTTVGRNNELVVNGTEPRANQRLTRRELTIQRILNMNRSANSDTSLQNASQEILRGVQNNLVHILESNDDILISVTQPVDPRFANRRMIVRHRLRGIVNEITDLFTTFGGSPEVASRLRRRGLGLPEIPQGSGSIVLHPPTSVNEVFHRNTGRGYKENMDPALGGQ